MYIVIATEEEVYRDIIYKDIPTGKYRVSNYGVVISTKKNTILKPFVDKDGYHKVTLWNKEIRYTTSIHRLVALTFVPNDNPEKTQINHKDTIRSNNYFENLEWTNPYENIQHSIQHGTFDKDRIKGLVPKVYNEELVHEICSLLEEGYKTKDILDIIEFDNRKKMISLIFDIRKKKSWIHISNQYKF